MGRLDAAALVAHWVVPATGALEEVAEQASLEAAVVERIPGGVVVDDSGRDPWEGDRRMDQT